MCESFPHHAVPLAVPYLCTCAWGGPFSGLEGQQAESLQSTSHYLTLDVPLRAPDDNQCSFLSSGGYVTFFFLIIFLFLLV